jgi:hypothetical protein
MTPLILALLLLSASFVVAQDNKPADSQNSAADKNSITVQGCISRLSGDYILMKQDPAVTYELQATGKIRLRNYLGQRVEVTGVRFPTMSTSSDVLTKTGSAAPVTINIKSIKAISKECSAR